MKNSEVHFPRDRRHFTHIGNFKKFNEMLKEIFLFKIIRGFSKCTLGPYSVS